MNRLLDCLPWKFVGACAFCWGTMVVTITSIFLLMGYGHH